MFSRLSELILDFLHVPAMPQAPFGGIGSARVFRAGRNYFRLRLVAWGARQLLALAGILFSVSILLRIEYDVRLQQASARAMPANSIVTPSGVQSPASQPSGSSKQARRQKNVTEADVARVAAQAPWWVWPLFNVAKGLGILLYLCQIPITCLAVRLEYEQRWYIVTDRSLRIREGLWRVQELTMSFANLQQVSVSQGPIERFFRIANVEVQSAGGGSSSSQRPDLADAGLHKGVFHGVDNAQEIRDLILERLQHFRATGLGDPDESPDHAPLASEPTKKIPRDDTLVAARDVLAEVRDLRRALRPV